MNAIIAIACTNVQGSTSGCKRCQANPPGTLTRHPCLTACHRSHSIGSTSHRSVCELTPSRGFSAELSAASTIVLATWFAIPVSTTQTLIGGVLGVGMARGIRALDLSVLGTIFIGWLLTLPGAALFTAIFYFLLRALF